MRFRLSSPCNIGHVFTSRIRLQPGLTSIRLAGTSKLQEVGGGYVFFCIGKIEESRLSGVGFAIESDLAKSLPSLSKGVSDGIMTPALDLKNNYSALLCLNYVFL